MERRALAIIALLCVLTSGSLAQQASNTADGRGAARFIPEDHRPPLAFRESWKHPGVQERLVKQEDLALSADDVKLDKVEREQAVALGSLKEDRADKLAALERHDLAAPVSSDAADAHGAELDEIERAGGVAQIVDGGVGGVEGDRRRLHGREQCGYVAGLF